MKVIIGQTGTYYKVFLNSSQDFSYEAKYTKKSKYYFAVYDNQQRVAAGLEDRTKSFFRLEWNEKLFIATPSDDRAYRLTCKNYYRCHWQLNDDEDTYDYYGHAGHFRSIFKNGVQVAKVDKKSFHFFERDTIYLICDDDANLPLLIMLVLKFDLGDTNEGNTFTYDFGRCALQVKEFDKKWRPKKIKA